MTKRFLGVLVLLILLSQFSGVAAAEYKNEVGVCGDGIGWILNPNTETLTITGTGKMANYGLRYESKEDQWYRDYPTYYPYSNYIKHVVVKNGITRIGEAAFYKCSKLIDITIPASVTQIGKEAFFGCLHLERANIPSGVTSIESETFTATSLKSISIPQGVTSIGYRAFESCDFTNVTIPASVKAIEVDAFRECSLLKEVRFEGSAPFRGDKLDYFRNDNITAFYPANDSTWTEWVEKGDHFFAQDGSVEWIPVSKPTISAQPKAVNCVSGDTASFTVTATGGDLHYQWQYYNSSSKTWDNVTNSAYSGLKNSTFSAYSHHL